MKIIEKIYKIGFIVFGLALLSIAIPALFNIEISEQFRSIRWTVTIVSAVIFAAAIFILSIKSINKYIKQDPKLFIKSALRRFILLLIIAVGVDYFKDGEIRIGFELQYSLALTITSFYIQDKILKR